MQINFLSACLLILLASPVFSDDLRHPSSINSFCVDPGIDDLCSHFPDDQIDFSDKFRYMFINVETQTPFDVFSWQAFTSLNWSQTGLPASKRNMDWQDFSRRPEVFGNDQAAENCSAYLAGAEVVTSSLVQSDGNVLIDQNGNYIVYETRINQIAENYILDELLNTQSGQKARDDSPVSFPQGRMAPDATPASVLVKTSWQVLPPNADETGYIVKDGLIYVAPEISSSGQGMCLQERLGLIGMHVVSRIHSGNGDEWLWTTFEHNLTVPNAGNSRRVNAIFSKDLFPGGCTAPKKSNFVDYILFDQECKDCKPNQLSKSNGKWAEKQPYAQGKPENFSRPSQIVRCWEVFEGTSEMNEMWQHELRDTSLRNYQLISTQWRGADKSPMFEHGEVPRFLSNTTMETFLQSESEGTCLGCHADAETSTGGDANFTFLLGEPHNN
jgi:hypothetical protein